MTSLNGNLFRVTGPLWGESTGHRWIPLTKTSDAELWCFLWSPPEKKRLSKQSRRRWFETPLRLSWRYCNGINVVYMKIRLFFPISQFISHIRYWGTSFACFQMKIDLNSFSFHYMYACSFFKRKPHQNIHNIYGPRCIVNINDVCYFSNANSDFKLRQCQTIVLVVAVTITIV